MTEPKLERDKLQIAILQRDVVREGGFYLAGGSGLATGLAIDFLRISTGSPTSLQRQRAWSSARHASAAA
jgi:hypothetical protein